MCDLPIVDGDDATDTDTTIRGGSSGCRGWRGGWCRSSRRGSGSLGGCTRLKVSTRTRGAKEIGTYVVGPSVLIGD